MHTSQVTCTPHTPLTYLTHTPPHTPHAHHAPLAYLPCAPHILTKHPSCTYHAPPAYIPRATRPSHTYHVPLTYLAHAPHIPTTRPSHTYHAPLTYIPCAPHTLTTRPSHTYHAPLGHCTHSARSHVFTLKSVGFWLTAFTLSEKPHTHVCEGSTPPRPPRPSCLQLRCGVPQEAGRGRRSRTPPSSHAVSQGHSSLRGRV